MEEARVSCRLVGERRGWFEPFVSTATWELMDAALAMRSLGFGETDGTCACAEGHADTTQVG